MARDMADLVGSISRMPAALRAAQKVGVTRAAYFTKKQIVQEIVRDVGADMRMSNARGRGKLGVGYQVKQYPGNAVAFVKPRGPAFMWRWLEDGTDGHIIRARGSKSTRRGNRRPGARALTTPNGLYTRVYVRGMEPKNTWSDGRRAAVPKLPEIIQEATRQAVVKAWK